MSRPEVPAPFPPLAEPVEWQMSLGERAALEGLLAATRPRLAVEVGTAEGGSLQRIAAHAGEVHSFDLVPPAPALAALPGVHVHTGDSHERLRAVLAEFAAAARRVDFALVDGDHSADGVRADATDLLDAPAVHRAVLVFHDTLNPEVRRGLDAVPWERWEKVRHVDLDAVAGAEFLAPLAGELWGGLGLVLVDADAGPRPGDPRQARVVPAPATHLAARAARARVAELEAQLAGRDADLARARAALAALQRSPSWRVTAPLRAAKRAVHRRGG